MNSCSSKSYGPNHALSFSLALNWCRKQANRRIRQAMGCKIGDMDRGRGVRGFISVRLCVFVRFFPEILCGSSNPQQVCMRVAFFPHGDLALAHTDAISQYLSQESPSREYLVDTPNRMLLSKYSSLQCQMHAWCTQPFLSVKRLIDGLWADFDFLTSDCTTLQTAKC